MRAVIGVLRCGSSLTLLVVILIRRVVGLSGTIVSFIGAIHWYWITPSLLSQGRDYDALDSAEPGFVEEAWFGREYAAPSSVNVGATAGLSE